jgi:STE24 endopeptidase
MDNKARKQKAYSMAKIRLSLAQTAIAVLYFALFIFFKFADKAEVLLSGLSSNPYVQATAFIVFLTAGLEVVTFPISFYGSFVIEHGFGLSNQAIGSWFLDYGKKTLLGACLFLIVFITLYYCLKNFPGNWWLLAGAAYLIFNIGLAKIFPSFIIPMFYRLTDIKDQAVIERMKAVSDKAGIRAIGISSIGLSAKTQKANAAVCGVWKNKKILLSDTLIDNYNLDEMEAVLAHELSHHKRGHFWKLSFAGFFFTLIGLYLVDLFLGMLISKGVIPYRYSLSGFPFMAIFFIVYNFFILPVTNLISRAYEFEADRDAVQLTGKPGAFRGLMEKLSGQNLSDPSPGVLTKIFFYDHPPVAERISACQNTIRA